MPTQRGSGRRRAVSRITRWAVVASVCLTPALLGRAGAAGGRSADDVADQIIAVQDKADKAAAQWTRLDDEARDIADQVTATQQSVDAAADTYDSMEETLATIAMNKYTGAVPQFGIPFTTSLMADVETEALAGFALGTGAVDLDQFGAARRDLERKQRALSDVQARNETAIQRVQTTRDDLAAQIEQLQVLEAELRDAEVKRAYDLKVAAKRQRDADEAAAANAASEAAAAAAAATAPVVASARGGGLAAITETPPAPVASAPAATSTTTEPAAPTTASRPGAGSTATPPTEPAATAVAAAPTTAAAPAPTTREPTTAPVAPAAPVTSGLVCPVAGTNAFGDTWGDARSGGRSHQGVDMISPSGTPLVAIDDGVATMKRTSLGGNSIGLTASDGTYYFYAHLSSFEGPSRAVGAGEVIGYVGRTGNTSVNHLHFEVHPGGGRAVNPYPIVRRIC